MEAVQSSQGADLFIGYGGVVERPAVAEAAEWFVYDHDDLTRALKCSKVRHLLCVCACVRVCARLCVRICVCVHEHVCVCLDLSVV
jgi:hypothetical protein